MANVATNTYRLNITPGGSPTVVYLNQYENGRSLVFQLISDTNFTIPSGSTAVFEGTKPDNNVFSTTGTLNTTNKTVTIQEATQMTAVAGEYAAKIKITNSGSTLATGLLRMVISEDTVTEDSQRSSTVLTGLIAEAQQYASAVPTLEARVDNLAHLTEGSTTGDAELIDIRVGADGTTYSSAGNAVRGQVGDLKSAVETSAYYTPVNIKYIQPINTFVTLRNTWYGGNDSSSYMLKKPDNAIEITVSTSEEQGTYVVFLPTSTAVKGTDVIYCAGTGRNWVPENAAKTFQIPEDCNYINILGTASDVDYTPLSVYFSNVLTKAEAVDPMINSTEIDVQNLSYQNLGILTNHKWGALHNTVISVNEIKSVTVKANDNSLAVVCFVKEVGETGSYVLYAENTGRNVIPAGQTQSFSVPSDCKYIAVLRDSDGIDYTPAKIWVSEYLSASKILDAINNEQVEDQYGLKCPLWSNDYVIMATSPAFDVPDGQRHPQGELLYSGSGNLKASDYIKLSGDMIEFPLIHTNDASYQHYGFSLYDKDKKPILGRAGSAIPNRQNGESFIGWTKVYIPKDAKYLRTTYWSDAFRNGRTDIPDFTYNLIKYPPTYEPITHELPVDMWMQHSIRRARQLTDIRWSPRVQIPRYSMLDGGSDHFLDWFYPDKEYVGIPYSGAGGNEGSGDWTDPKEWGYAHNWVGAHIPFEAFVTAARYPNSIFSETVNQTVPLYYSPPFGIVCTGLVNYTVDGPWPLRGISNFFDRDPLGGFAGSTNLIQDYNLDLLMIGDFLYTAPHVIVITDIIRDSDGDGHVKYVEMSEATTVGNGNNNVLGGRYGGVARRNMWDANEFKNRYGAYKVYRRYSFWGIPYNPTKYVDTGNEGSKINIVDFPCIPYLGNTAVYKVGYIHNSKILIGASGFTTLVVTKDGESFGEFPITGVSEVSVGFTDAGYYEAYLTNGATRSKACNWTVEA